MVDKKEVSERIHTKIPNFLFSFLTPFTGADIISFLSVSLTSRPFILQQRSLQGFILVDGTSRLS
jgi:hypothetical protein